MGASANALGLLPQSMTGVWSYIFRRLLISIPVLLGVTLLIYLMVDLAPGDPVSAMVSPRDAGLLGEDWIARERARLGFDQPFIVRYGIWLGQAVQGNVGYSLISGRPVGEMIAARLGPTLRLTITALVLSTILSICSKIVIETASRIIPPHEGVGGGTPNPRKLNADSIRIASAMPNVAVTIKIGASAGNTCRIRMRKSDTPTLRAASTYSRSRSESTSARTSRTT